MSSALPGSPDLEEAGDLDPVSKSPEPPSSPARISSVGAGAPRTRACHSSASSSPNGPWEMEAGLFFFLSDWAGPYQGKVGSPEAFLPDSKMAFTTTLRMQREAAVLPSLKMAAPTKMTGVCRGDRGSRMV